MAIEGGEGSEGGGLQERRNSRANEETGAVVETGEKKKVSTGVPLINIPPNGRC